MEAQRLNDMVYIYYNLRLWVRQLERTLDMEAISLDVIDTTAEWRVEAERPVMESAPDWIEQEVVEGGGRGGEAAAATAGGAGGGGDTTYHYYR